MIKIYLFLFFVIGCSHSSKPTYPPEGFVTGEAALNHIKASYLLGCVEAFHELKIPKSFDHCRSKSEVHKTEIENLMNQTPVESTPL